MRKPLPVALAILFVAGCMQDKQAAGADAAVQASPTAESAVVAAEPCPEPTNAYHPMPDGVLIDGEFMVRNDRIIQAKNGAVRRRVALELVGQDLTQAAESVLGQVESVGFQRVQVQDRGDGQTRLAATKNGEGRVNIVANPDPGKNRSHPESTGVLVIDWQIASPTLEAGQGG